LQVKVLPGKLSVRPGSYRGGEEGNRVAEALGGAQEKTLAELKGEFALDVVPTKDYTANSAWQQLSILAHNVARSFQLDTFAETKPRSRKRT
jgi:hypothetical protein